MGESVLGTVREIWRHPVKSLEGERLEAASLGHDGVPGDRAWAVRDEVRGGIRGAKKIPALMALRARFPREPTEPDEAPEIALPDGTRLAADAADAAARVSEAVGHPVTLWPRLPADRLEHYRRGAPDHGDMLAELRDIFGRRQDEPLPDLSAFPPEILEYESPPGTYFDAFPLLLLTTASLKELARRAPDSRVDVRRFRPNIVVETPAGVSGFVESGWEGRRLRLGEAVLELTIGCPRCVMITHGFDDLPRDPGLMRTVVRGAGGNLGVYARVATPGSVRVGDTLVDPG